MSIFASVGIVILAMLIMGFLQLTPGVFAIFSHYAFGKFSKPKASDFILFFIIGVETVTVCLFLSIYFLTCIFFFGDLNFDNDILVWILSGILISLGLASLFFYFRRGSGTKLFISRKYAKAFDDNAKAVKSRSDAFLLGLLAGSYEIIFTLPLHIVTSIAIINIDIMLFPSDLLAMLYVLTPIIPLFVIYWQYRTGHNLADIIKSRIRNKNFVRFILCFSYLLIAVLIIYTKAIIS